MSPTPLSSPLLSLTAELRNLIYDFTFTHDVDASPTTEIDIRDPRPPSKHPLFVCRQIYHEAAGIYRSAYRRYWREGRFVLDGRRRRIRKHEIEALDAAATAQIRTFAVTDVFALTPEFARVTRYSMVDPRGGWRLEVEMGDAAGVGRWRHTVLIGAQLDRETEMETDEDEDEDEEDEGSDAAATAEEEEEEAAEVPEIGMEEEREDDRENNTAGTNEDADGEQVEVSGEDRDEDAQTEQPARSHFGLRGYRRAYLDLETHMVHWERYEDEEKLKVDCAKAPVDVLMNLKMQLFLLPSLRYNDM